jgi:negative regulator of flagellin synthesis FlgM
MNIPSDLNRTQQTQQAYAATVATNKAQPSSSTAPADTPSLSVTKADQAHLSAAADFVSQSASVDDVRTEKVSAIQSALANGTYHVESSQVATQVISHMLGNGQ